MRFFALCTIVIAFPFICLTASADALLDLEQYAFGMTFPLEELDTRIERVEKYAGEKFPGETPFEKRDWMQNEYNKGAERKRKELETQERRNRLARGMGSFVGGLGKAYMQYLELSATVAASHPVVQVQHSGYIQTGSTQMMPISQPYYTQPNY